MTSWRDEATSGSASTGPLFLAGVDRSGIGLLTDLLDRHPAFAISRRTNFWTFFDGRFGDLAEDDNLDACVDALMRFRRIRDTGVDPDRLREAFVESPNRDYARLFALIGQQHAEARGKVRWGDKSLGAERHADRILQAYPDAHMLHVLRDPRDRHVSLTQRRGARRGGVATTSDEWRDSVRMAERNVARFGSRYRVVRYEDLVTAPRVVLEEICEFLDVAVVDGAAWTESTAPGSIHTRSMGRFRTELRPREIAFIDHILGPEMVRHGYSETSLQLRRVDSWVLRVWDLPRGRTMIAMRRVWTAFRSHLPARPSARRLVA